MPRTSSTRRRTRRPAHGARDDRAAAGVLGAILLFAILAGAILYVNAYQVPDKGAQWERQQLRLLDAETDRIAATLSSAPLAGNTLTLPVSVTPPSGGPSVLRGLILDPATPGATIGFDPDGTRLRITHVDPANTTRHLLGNATSGIPIGAFTLTTVGAYVQPVTYTIEAGASLRGASGSHHLAQPPDWTRRTDAADVDTLALTLPRMSGPGFTETATGNHALTLTPTAHQTAGGTTPAADEVTLELWTPRAHAWGAWMNATFTPHTAAVDPDAGHASITLTPTRTGGSIALDLAYVDYAITWS